MPRDCGLFKRMIDSACNVCQEILRTYQAVQKVLKIVCALRALTDRYHSLTEGTSDRFHTLSSMKRTDTNEPLDKVMMNQTVRP